MDLPAVQDGARELQGDRRQPNNADGPDVVRAGERHLVDGMAHERAAPAGVVSVYAVALLDNLQWRV